MIRTTRLLAMAFVAAAVAGVSTTAHAATGRDRDRPTASQSVYVTGGPTTLSDNHAPIGPRD
ncbi:hypothetical protein AMK26_26565 [Streptomyces sp. CB03234]|uniref:hypothetical protein n=1 Tax=Streptomyces sp. (strain CB03234) TaxID=1703937 RepID=UPI000939EA31|nr:hypothetical protein [Streptomyces sp. CB03234]OKJ99590.1 hypothetical protein AMK26_26565 [Streptomyces sp. CB03234]